jgi:lipopolysaccharide biosynthesis glycosyltransferase
MADDYYVPYSGVSILSLLENNKEFDEINLFFIDLGISVLNKNKLLDMVSSYGRTISFIKIDNLEFYKSKGLNVTENTPHYVDLFLQDLLPDKVEKILYLDSDSIIIGSFKELWQLNIENYYLGAALEIKLNFDTAGHAKKLLGLSEIDPYVNAGVLLLNLKKMRENNIGDKFVDYINSHEKITYYDQDTINVVLRDNIKIIDLKYNFFPEFFKLGYNNVIKWTQNKCYYSEKEFENALKNIIYLHFQLGLTGKPWYKKNNVPCANEFEKYVNLSLWKNQVYTDDEISLKFKILSIFVYKLPFSIFIIILNLVRTLKRWN